MDQRVTEARQALDAKAVAVSIDWLRECLSFLLAQTPARFVESELMDQVYRQYLLSDLTLCGRPALPPNCVSRHAVDLVSQVPQPALVLQVVDVVDVATPVQQIIEKLEEIEAAKVAQTQAASSSSLLAGLETKQPTRSTTLPRGTLKLALSDGFQTLPALEYQPIPQLSLTIPLGTKILLRKAPIRRGMLMLEESILTVLGGQVEALNEKSLLNRLRLKLDPNHRPKPVQPPPLDHGSRLSPTTANDNTTPADSNSMSAFTQGAAQRPAPSTTTFSAAPIQINLDDSMDDIAVIDPPRCRSHAMDTGSAVPDQVMSYNQSLPQPDSPDGFVIDLDSDFEQDMLAHASALVEPPLVAAKAISDQIKQGQTLVRVRTKVISMAKFAFKNNRFSLITILQDTVGTTRLKTKLSHEVILQVTKITPEEFAQSRPETKSRRSMELLQKVQSSIAGLSGIMTLDLAEQCTLWQQNHDSASLDSFTLTDVHTLPLIVAFQREEA